METGDRYGKEHGRRSVCFGIDNRCRKRRSTVPSASILDTAVGEHRYCIGVCRSLSDNPQAQIGQASTRYLDATSVAPDGFLSLTTHVRAKVQIWVRNATL